MKLYVLGPMTDVPHSNAPEFHRVTGHLRDRGHEVFNPVEFDEAEGLDLDAANWTEPEYVDLLRRDLLRILEADVDGGVALDGWEESRGARGEVHVLRTLGRPIFRLPDDPLADLIVVEDEPRPAVRTFATGATRDTDEGKPDYEGYLSPVVLRAYGRYMLKHGIQPDGEPRASDNWQQGIPADAYMKSAWRHFMDWWEQHREPDGGGSVDVLEEAICALLFNAMGYLHELSRD